MSPMRGGAGLRRGTLCALWRRPCATDLGRSPKAVLKIEFTEARGDKKKSRRGEERREREGKGRAIYLLRRNIQKRSLHDHVAHAGGAGLRSRTPCGTNKAVHKVPWQ